MRKSTHSLLSVNFAANAAKGNLHVQAASELGDCSKTTEQALTLTSLNVETLSDPESLRSSPLSERTYPNKPKWTQVDTEPENLTWVLTLYGRDGTSR